MKTREWLARQKKDQFVKRASKQGFVSRSAFKLIEIEKKCNLIKGSKSILELGSSPGGWSQVIMNCNSNRNLVFISIDKINLKINESSKFYFINGDFNDPKTLNKIKEKYNKKFDLILSDMAPNTIGHTSTDHLRIMRMANDVYNFGFDLLNNNGNMVIKIWQGAEEKDFIKKIKCNFNRIQRFKPDASRSESSEIYLLLLKFNKKNL
ncbi:MAG: Ribosomal RNA large subunit methyltransferase E [Alphaproteobacteria bacterium MarineAlpha5_Bin11]|nr:MAG: Ribosomal RNA large subunit methyltransferase E [Alphaproteobacteria bacterium MarineAlpha5_Bin11]|tara:strand:- start:28764 stop:29387 length:624 start_codon:yes stop_codon:yes gene_type:complete